MEWCFPGGIPHSVTQGHELLATCLVEKHLHHGPAPPHSSRTCPRSTQNQGTTLFPPLWPVQQSLRTKPNIRPSWEEMLFKGPGRVSMEQGESMNLDLIAGPGREYATAQTWGALAIEGRRIQVRQDFHCRDLHKPRKKQHESQRGNLAGRGVRNNVIDSVSLEHRESGGETQ